MLRVAARPAASQLSAHAECHTHIETPEERVRRIWRNADAVAFDVDSTVCQDEAIDELANFLGVGEAVANVTRQAMNGNARFRHALKARLEVMRPTYDQLEQYANETKPKLTPGIRELVALLHKRARMSSFVSVGKPAVMGLLKKQGYKQLVMVGDGATDLEAAPPADAFIGFGKSIREAVRTRADWYVTDFEILRKALE
ncbi:putative phosphoserine phosphatase SerB [Cooperia oncophora]